MSARAPGSKRRIASDRTPRAGTGTAALRIAIAGSAGVGKTRLAAALSASLRWPLIDEGYDSFFNADHSLARPSALKRLMSATLEHKRRAAARDGACIADRSPADLFAFWLGAGLFADQAATAAFYARCRADIALYDGIVVLPWGALPLRQLPPASRRRRITNPWSQLFAHATIVGLLQQWLPPERIIPVPFDCRTFSRRVRYVIDALARLPTARAPRTPVPADPAGDPVEH